MVVAPLTSTLMSSVPVRNAGLASAINNAISRVGQPLLSAVIFIVITASFYSSLAAKVPGLDAERSGAAGRRPAAQPAACRDLPAVVTAAHEASTDAFHLAVLVSAALLAAGAAVNFVGLRPASAGGRSGAPSPARSEPANEAIPARDWDAATYDRIADPDGALGRDGPRAPATAR